MLRSWYSRIRGTDGEQVADKPGEIEWERLKRCHQQQDYDLGQLKKGGQSIRRERLKKDDIDALVFQGGGAKGIAYCGAIKELAERGILQNVNKFGGASAGAICAAFLALGCTVDEMGDLLKQDFQEMLMGDRWYDKFLSFIPGQKKVRGFIAAIHNYGVYSTSSFHDWMGYEFTKRVDKKGQSNTSANGIKDKPNITFKEVYDLFGAELCVIVSNVSTQTEEYYHPKTTPDFPVRDAVRMSMSIPLLFEPIKMPFYKEMDYYVDGGFVCNYPVHCFDGWWLSMDSQDAFTEKLGDGFQTICRTLRTDRFQSTGRKQGTLGFRVVMEKNETTGQTETEMLYKRDIAFHDLSVIVFIYIKAKSVALWDTELARKYNERIKAMNKGRETVKHVDDLLRVLKEIEEDNQTDCTEKSRTKILDCLKNAPELKKKLEEEQREGDIRFTFRDLESAIYEITKRPLAEWMTNNPRRKISGISDFVHCLADLINVTSKADNVYGDYHERNEWRTITIETKYIDTTDFKMAELDKKFLIKQGEFATRGYFNDIPPQHTNE